MPNRSLRAPAAAPHAAHPGSADHAGVQVEIGTPRGPAGGVFLLEPPRLDGGPHIKREVGPHTPVEQLAHAACCVSCFPCTHSPHPASTERARAGRTATSARVSTWLCAQGSGEAAEEQSFAEPESVRYGGQDPGSPAGTTTHACCHSCCACHVRSAQVALLHRCMQTPSALG